MVANYVDFDLSTAPAPGERASCVWKGVPVMCGPRGLPGAKNILYHNLGDGKFEDVPTKAHIDQTNGHYCVRRVHVRFRQRRLARYLHGLRQHCRAFYTTTITTALSLTSR